MLGANDFIEYWTAFRLLMAGQNLYDPQLMAELQRAQGFPAEPPLMMWLPPWALIVFAPLLVLSFQQSVCLWALSSIAAAVISANILRKLFSIESTLLCYSSLLFVPLLSSLVLGQVSIFLLFAALLFLQAYHAKRDIRAGVALVVCSFKPHLFIAFGLVLFLEILRKKRFGVLYGFSLGLAFLVLVTFLASPTALGYWWSNLLQSSDGAPKKLEWITPTLSGMLRFTLPTSLQTNTYLAFLPAGIASLAIGIFASVRAWPKDFVETSPLLLCFSFLVAPFGWLFDAVLLLPAYLLILRAYRNTFRRETQLLMVAFLLQGMILLIHSNYLPGQQWFFWFPLALTSLYAAVTHRRNLTAASTFQPPRSHPRDE